MALDPESQDAVAYLEELLRSYGLEELGSWAYEQVTSGNSPTMIRQLLWQQPAFKKRFKVIFDRQAKGLSAISVNEVIDYERKGRQLLQAAGLPSGFYDTPDDFYNFLLNDISLSELNDRVQIAKEYTYNIDATTRAEIQRLYGLTDGDFTAHALDPQRAVPILQNKFTSARTAAASIRSGYGQLDTTEAERLTSLGVDPNSAAQGFAALVQSRQLFNALPGMETAEDEINREDQLSAAFGGDETARQRLARRGETRAASRSAGGGFVSDNQGFGGLGSASS
jgi:hypothetical protein